MTHSLSCFCTFYNSGECEREHRTLFPQCKDCGEDAEIDLVKVSAVPLYGQYKTSKCEGSCTSYSVSDYAFMYFTQKSKWSI